MHPNFCCVCLPIEFIQPSSTVCGAVYFRLEFVLVLYSERSSNIILVSFKQIAINRFVVFSCFLPFYFQNYYILFVFSWGFRWFGVGLGVWGLERRVNSIVLNFSIWTVARTAAGLKVCFRFQWTSVDSLNISTDKLLKCNSLCDDRLFASLSLFHSISHVLHFSMPLNCFYCVAGTKFVRRFFFSILIYATDIKLK